MFKNIYRGDSLVVQWLGLDTARASFDPWSGNLRSRKSCGTATRPPPNIYRDKYIINFFLASGFCITIKRLFPFLELKTYFMVPCSVMLFFFLDLNL